VEGQVIERKVADAAAAETVVRRALENQYGTKLKGMSFRKCWYSAAGTQEFWDVEGALIWKRGLFSSEAKNFRYQVDTTTGRIIGYELTTPISSKNK
jgi:hypothetical protein